jgi:hypothetical protein
MFVYKQIEALKNIRDLARKLRDLLFPPHGDDQNLLAAVTALRGMRADVESDGGDDLGEMIDSRINNPEEEFRDQLERIASNCAGAQVKLSDDMVDPHASGFVEHAAWDKWICDILRILEESNLLKGVGSNSILSSVTPAVRLILELQGLLPGGERRHQHSASGLAQAMKRARRATRT